MRCGCIVLQLMPIRTVTLCSKDIAPFRVASKLRLCDLSSSYRDLRIFRNGRLFNACRLFARQGRYTPAEWFDSRGQRRSSNTISRTYNGSGVASLSMATAFGSSTNRGTPMKLNLAPCCSYARCNSPNLVVRPLGGTGSARQFTIRRERDPARGYHTNKGNILRVV